VTENHAPGMPSRGEGRSAFIGKVVPPVPAPHVIARSRVAAALAVAAQRRVTAMVAGAGFGKTTALAAWASEQHCAWYTVSALDRDPIALAKGLLTSLTLRVPGLADALAPALDGARGPDARGGDVAGALIPALAEALHTRLTTDVTLVLDELQELEGEEAAVRLVTELCHTAPPRLHLVLASRTDLPLAASALRLAGQLQLLTADALGFDVPETAALLDAVAGPPGPAAEVQRLTGGWPAAVRLVAEALAGAAHPDRVLARMVAADGAVRLVEDLLDREVPADLAGLLRTAAVLDAFHAPLLRAVGIADADRLLDSAARRGVHVVPAPSPDGWYTLTPLSRAYARTRLAIVPEEVAEVHIRAAEWHAANGGPATALRYLCLAGDGSGVATLLETAGAVLLAGGHAAAVLDALALVPAKDRTPALDLVEGEACQLRGDWDQAVTCLSRLIPDDGPAPAAAAWRLGMIQHLRGEPELALELYVRGRADPDGSAADLALTAAWGAAAAWLTGDADTCRALAADGLTLAESTSDHRALAAVHTALAMLAALDGDRRGNDMHYLRALDHAQKAGDVLQVIRIRANRGSRFLEEGYYTEAIAELETAIGLAEVAGFDSLRTLALYNRGEAARWLGRLEDAARDFSAALAEWQRLGSRMAGYALEGLAAVQADQGHLSLARAAYEEAIELAEPTGDVQGLVPALAGLATVLAPDDPETAAKLTARALALPGSLGHTEALLAAGRIALRRGDPDGLRRYADEAAGTARRRRDRAAIAESLELRGAAAVDPAEKVALLSEAEALWAALRCPLPLARIRLALARTGLSDVDLSDVERTCRELGARTLAAEAAAARAARSRTRPPEVAVRVLGAFRVLRAGEPVPYGAWQSRKARDLLKILVSRRGAPVPREVLCELLWPQAEPVRAQGRLSVAISTLRAVLDPQRGHGPDRYIASGEGAVRLRLEQVDVDVEAFLRLAAAAAGTPGTDALSAAEAAYTGDFCEEDRYADWAQALREEARATYVSITRSLAYRHAERDDHEAAVRYLLRLLASEPYDEQAHLALVRELDATGRHGDARRMYRGYAARMAELGVELAPYPSGLDRGRPPAVPPPVARQAAEATRPRG